MIGSPGSGKTTLSYQLTKLTGLPYVGLDDIYWRPDGTHLTEDELLRNLGHTLKKKKWIVDGNYDWCLEFRLDYAEAVVFLDIPTTICLGRTIKRGWRRPQSGDADQSKKSFRNKNIVRRLQNINWELYKLILTFRWTNRPKILSGLRTWSDGPVVILRNYEQIHEFLLTFQSSRFVNDTKIP